MNKWYCLGPKSHDTLPLQSRYHKSSLIQKYEQNLHYYRCQRQRRLRFPKALIDLSLLRTVYRRLGQAHKQRLKKAKNEHVGFLTTKATF